jgi:uncharacterized protein YsxB (DUF464 family)
VLTVTFHRDARDRISAITARGHVRYAVETDDVVCAAASAILQAAQLGLERYAGITLEATQKPFRLEWPKARRDDEALRAIVATAELSIEQLARQYPEHIRLSHKRAADERNTARSNG